MTSSPCSPHRPRLHGQPASHRPRPEARDQAIDSEYVVELVANIRASRCYLSAHAKGFLDSLEDRAGRFDIVLFSEKQWEWFVALLEQASVDFEAI